MFIQQFSLKFRNLLQNNALKKIKNTFVKQNLFYTSRLEIV